MGDYIHRPNKIKEEKINQGQDIIQADDSTNTPSGSNLLKWLIIVIVAALLFGGGYWYYNRYINKAATSPSPSPEVTEAVWKTKSEKTLNDFMGYWLKMKGSDGQDQAQKARDLLTISAQAHLEILKNPEGKNYTNLTDKLNAFIGVSGPSEDYQITGTRKIDEKKVEINLKLRYNQESVERICTVILEGSSWLIDSFSEKSTIVSPSVSSSPTSSPSLTSPTPTNT